MRNLPDSFKHASLEALISRLSFVNSGAINIKAVPWQSGDMQGTLKDCKGKQLPEETVLDWFIQMTLALKYVHDKNILHRQACHLCDVFFCGTSCIQVPVSALHAVPEQQNGPECLQGHCTDNLCCNTQSTNLSAFKHCVLGVGRDFKTANVFRAEGGLLKVGDFGVSKVLSSTLALAKTAIGTPYYISPEICLNRPYNAKVRVLLLQVTQPFPTARHSSSKPVPPRFEEAKTSGRGAF